MKGDLEIVKAALIERVESVCNELLPDGRREGSLWVSYNPVENDRGKTPALKIRIRSGDLGAWKCWRCGESGDILKLVAYVNRTDIAGALVWARDYLGMRSMTREDREKMRRAAATQKVRREKDALAERRRKWERAQRLFFDEPFPCGSGSPAEMHARAYFAARKVPLENVQNLNTDTFRFSAGTEWWKGAEWKQDNGRRMKVRPGPEFPAIHSAMRQWNGFISACHLTFLDPAKPAKAPVDPPKLMFGEALGAVIETSCGPEGVPFWQAQEAHPLICAEGIESALPLAIALPQARVWACGSLAGIGHAPVHLPCVQWVMFARDNNSGNAQAQKQFEQALTRLESHGKRVVVGASHVGDDFNDLATGED